jgi:hypothetical protein
MPPEIHGKFIMDAKSILDGILQTEPGSAELSEKDLEDDDILRVLGVMKEHWTRPLKSTYAALEAAERFGLLDKYTSRSLMPSGDGELDVTYKKIMFALTRLEMQLYMRHIVDIQSGSFAEDVAGSDLKQDLRSIYLSVTQMHRCLKYDLLARKALDPSWAIQCPNFKDELLALDETKCDKYQSFLIYVLQKIQEKGYRRYNEQCYEEILSPPLDDGNGSMKRYNTHAWQFACTIPEFVHSIASLETTFEIWLKMTTNDFRRKIIEHLREYPERKFMDLKPDRHWHSFRNGIYDTRRAAFFPYGSKEVPPDVISCKYHELEFDTGILEYDDWTDIATPSLQRILDYQLSVANKDEVMRWVYVFMGRLLFEVNELDKWQVILFCLGRAGTGKSKMLDCVTNFFCDEDVAVLANNSQKDFGLQTFVDKYMWTCYEVKHDFSLDQANFQSMVTGEKVVIQRKHKTALSVLWKIPGILAGNEVPTWQDNSGSIGRRIILIKFDRKVLSEKVDPHLDKKIKQEMGALLHKCCKAYLQASQMYGESDIWKKYKRPDGSLMSVLPSYFHEKREELVETVHPLANFIANSKLHVVDPGTNVGMPFHRFQELANDYFLNKNYPKFSWGVQSKYKAVLEDYSIVYKKIDANYIKARGNVPMEYNGMEYRAGTEWLFGITEFDGPDNISDSESEHGTEQPMQHNDHAVDHVMDQPVDHAQQPNDLWQLEQNEKEDVARQTPMEYIDANPF